MPNFAKGTIAICEALANIDGTTLSVVVTLHPQQTTLATATR